MLGAADASWGRSKAPVLGGGLQNPFNTEVAMHIWKLQSGLFGRSQWKFTRKTAVEKFNSNSSHHSSPPSFAGFIICATSKNKMIYTFPISTLISFFFLQVLELQFQRWGVRQRNTTVHVKVNFFLPQLYSSTCWNLHPQPLCSHYTMWPGCIYCTYHSIAYNVTKVINVFFF